jgi:hypothetical protein
VKRALQKQLKKCVMGKYSFLKSQSGETVPALACQGGDPKPLHSMVDPKREARRLVRTIADDTGFVIFLGLGGGFAPQEVLEKTNSTVVVIDFFIDEIRQLLSSKDYSCLLNNERFFLLCDLCADDIKNFILENYNPSFNGNIKTIPLRTRTEADKGLFDGAAAAIQQAIGAVTGDYSVQAHFGMRWFSNIIRNIKTADTPPAHHTHNTLAFPVNEAAIAAAGPSLDMQMPLLSECKDKKIFIISSDTALPALLHNGIKPDAVVSIDCQHISYYHFLCSAAKDRIKIPLILDIASPPPLSSFSSFPVFFSSGHPLSQYVRAQWKNLPQLDTSGGNVTYACLSFAENIGAKRITLFGADFSYIGSRTYARGTYVYPFFDKKQNRFTPSQSLLSAFLYRSPFLPLERQNQSYYETSSLRFYRQKLEEKASSMDAQIMAAKGQGSPLDLSKRTADTIKSNTPFIFMAQANIKGTDFLEQYRSDIAALPDYINDKNLKNKNIFTTLLPCAAAIKHRNKELNNKELLKELKRHCVGEIEKVLSAGTT